MATQGIPDRPQTASPPAKPPALAAPAGWADLPRTAPAKIAPATPPAGNQPRQETLPLLQDLPTAIRGELPELNISLHYYTTDPAARMIRLNGLILREGQAFNERLVLQEITSSGVIFRFGETRFRMRAI